MKPTPTIEHAIQFLARVSEMLIVKNEKYGDSAANPLRIFSKLGPREQLYVRIDDKLSRIGRGVGMADDEDVLLDLVGYLALLAGVRDEQR